MPVNAGRHHDLLLGHEVKDTIGESMEQSRSKVMVDDCEGRRITFDGVEALIKRLKELGTKVVTSVAIPLGLDSCDKAYSGIGAHAISTHNAPAKLRRARAAAHSPRASRAPSA